MIFESCVIPILLYDCENWFLTDSLLAKLEAFQAEIGRRILSTTLPVQSGYIAVNWPSIATQILAKKLAFLIRTMGNEGSLSNQFFSRLLETSENAPL